jgi:hypothetical protein
MKKEQKKIRITIEIDVGTLAESGYFFVVLVCRMFYFPVVLLLYCFVGDRAFTQRQRFEAYTAKKGVTQQTKTQEIGEEDEIFYTTSWDIYSNEQTKCLNSTCQNTFQKVVRGNQTKRFCGQKCKDDFHNQNKKQQNK